MRVLIRLIMGVLIAGMIGVAIVPVLVLRDLNSGGSGWGLCESGLSGCSTSYFAGFELAAILLAILFGLLGLYRVALKALRWSEHQYDRRRSLRVHAAVPGENRAGQEPVSAIAVPPETG